MTIIWSADRLWKKAVLPPSHMAFKLDSTLGCSGIKSLFNVVCGWKKILTSPPEAYGQWAQRMLWAAYFHQQKLFFWPSYVHIAHCFLCSLGTSEAGQIEYKMCSDKLQSLFERWWAMCCVPCAMWNVLCAMCTLWKDCNTQSFGRAVSLLRDETTVNQLAPSFGSLTSDN